MSGMNAVTGRHLSGIDHIRQSVRDILTTPIGSRVMRRDYGSLLPELIDQPMNDATRLRLYAASVMAIIRWEPRVQISSVKMIISTAQPGKGEIFLSGQTKESQPIEIMVTL
ncbi:MAG: GPW/gp25 family protein [Pseudohongiella sp.]|nr:GPW/gp25 family protein [Pseudohongiella sp.]